MANHPVGPYPTQHYVHLVSTEIRRIQGTVKKVFHTYPINIERPVHGRRTEALECGTCGRPLAYTVLSVEATRRRRLMWGMLTLLGLLAAILCFAQFLDAGDQVYDDPRSDPTAVLGMAALGGFFLFLISLTMLSNEDGVRGPGRILGLGGHGLRWPPRNSPARAEGSPAGTGTADSPGAALVPDAWDASPHTGLQTPTLRPLSPHLGDTSDPRGEERTPTGYHLTVVQGLNQAEKDAKAAARAYLDTLTPPHEVPEEEREAAEWEWREAALAAVDRSSFHFDDVGMANCRQLMDRLGMVTHEDAPRFPSLEDYGLDEYPKDPADYYGGRRTKVEARLTNAERRFLAALKAATDFEPEPVRGIPIAKLSTNDGWLVTPRQIEAALSAWNRQPGLVRISVATEYEWWIDWVPFLAYAKHRGGFRVKRHGAPAPGGRSQ